ncbi:hypothetical protein BX589_10113 [Paraburkholderia fungorum]|jgi:hypothetical protein|uniref:hypothetical protein n=1 Tax=Paraburkholderia fungorum TaxID=134537 RepID=UPI000D079E4B|nr:hypothetical protein [Paraburkholderia fungorum]PRZ56363.1 hypothetical protein BX589_10113 [Paraburkholderia fungorum]
MATKKPYEERTDLEKVQSQWNKIHGLHSREEWSAAVVRAATATELAANFAIRAEYAARSTFEPAFVDKMLRWANGLSGKLRNLLLPLTAAEPKKHKTIKALSKRAEQINDTRNAVAHQGEFCSVEEAQAVIEHAEAFIHDLVQLYEPDFELKTRKK